MALKRADLYSTVMSKFDEALMRVGGRGGCVEALGVSPGGAASSADLGGSSKYSNENLED